MSEKEISKAVIGRLPRYYRYLGELKTQGVERISSQELSKLMHVTASQIRQQAMIVEIVANCAAVSFIVYWIYVIRYIETSA